MKGEGKGHVLIVGAGVVGLLLAQALQKNDITYTIFEAEDSADFHRSREWGLSIQWALLQLSQLLPSHLLERLQSASVDPQRKIPKMGNAMPAYNVLTGELMKAVPLGEFLRVSRRKMRALSAEGLDVQYGKALVSLDVSVANEVTGIFADGSKATGTLLVGADGANSIVRSLVLPAGQCVAERSPYGGVNMHVCYHDAAVALAISECLTPITAIGVHPKGYWLWISVQDVPDHKKPEGWVFQLQWTWRLDSGNQDLAHLDIEQLQAEAAASFAEPFRSAWLRIAPGTRVSTNKISVFQPVTLPAQVHGRVTLIGDAAHAMSFHRGQGLNHGINDVATLVSVLSQVVHGGKLQEEAVTEYEAEMIARAGEEVKIGQMNMEMMHDWERLSNSAFMQRGEDKNT